MKIQLFENGRGLIHGTDSKRISCHIAGTLVIGTAQISIAHDTEEIMPLLFNGSTGTHNATFTSELGNVYELGKIQIKVGRIVPPSQTAVDLMELRCRVDALEAECKALREENLELKNIFDTNSLNFLIK